VRLYLELGGVLDPRFRSLLQEGSRLHCLADFCLQIRLRMLFHRPLLRCFSGKRLAPQLQPLFPSAVLTCVPVSCRQLAVTLVTVAPNQRRPGTSPPNPTINKINSRAQQLAEHLLPLSRAVTTITPTTMTYTTRKIAAANTLEHRIFIEKDGQLVSAWHDIPLYANEQQTILNMIVEVPRWTNAKMEVCSPPLCTLQVPTM
jgi:inorganic pyrophosphatase